MVVADDQHVVSADNAHLQRFANHRSPIPTQPLVWNNGGEGYFAVNHWVG